MKENIMKIEVIHTAFEDAPQTVAIVDAPPNMTDEERLEYAYRWTNNVAGSWSRRDLQDNGDYNPDVTVVAPLNEGGMGIRSTSMGDEMIMDGHKYVVSAFGFRSLEEKVA